MSRNSAGLYTLPVGAFSPGGLIKSSDHNQNYSDIANALTQSLATTGVSTMTGPIVAMAGSVASVGYGFTGDTNTGFYKPAAHQIGWSYGGVQGGVFNSDNAGGVSFGAAVTVAGNLTVANAGTITGPGSVPAGALMPYAGSAAPTGWLLCFGQSLSRAGFPALFAAIGTTYGAVDGASFSVPDLRGRVPTGQDNMGGAAAGRMTAAGGLDGTILGQGGGEQTHLLTTPEMPSHNHTLTDNGHVHGGVASGATFGSGGFAGARADITQNTASATTGITLAATGGGGAHNNVQPALILTYIIKT